MERAAANVELVRRSKLDPLVAEIVESIARARKLKLTPFAYGMAPTIAVARKSKLNMLTAEAAASIAASIALGGIGVVSWAVASPVNAAPESRPQTVTAASPALADAAERTRTDSAASRSHNRVTAVPGAAPARTPGAPRAARPAPVTGLDRAAMDNAVAVVQAGREMNLPKRAYVVAIATTLQESQLRNLANPGIPESLNLPNQGTGQDFDSVGLFQQRASMGWGTIEQLMDPKSSARAFYSVLVTVPGWEQMSVANAAQAVQRSAFPHAYAQHEERAQQIVDAIA